MREGLAREFPEAGRAVSWTRGRIGGLRREPRLWAAISALGAGFLLSVIVQAAIGLTHEAFLAVRSSPPFALFPLVTITGTAAAAAVALAIGGPIVLALYLTYVALDSVLRMPALMTFCERSGGVIPGGVTGLPGPDQCTPMGYLAAMWPLFVGIGAGIALAPAITTRGSGINPVLRIAGGFALAQFVLGHVWAATAAQTANALTSGLTVAAGVAAAAVAAGVVAAQLPRGVRGAAIVAGIWLLPWLTFQLPNALRTPASAVPSEHVVPILAGIVIQPVACALLVLTAAVAARSRFVPRAAA